MVDQKRKRVKFWTFIFDWIGFSCLTAFICLMIIDLIIIVKRLTV